MLDGVSQTQLNLPNTIKIIHNLFSDLDLAIVKPKMKSPSLPSNKFIDDKTPRYLNFTWQTSSSIKYLQPIKKKIQCRF